MGKKRIATTWLDGCSGCHMSLLDMDEQLIDIAGQVDIVYGPLVDTKAIPEGIDVVLVEGAVSSDADAEKLLLLRARSAILVSLGDCAVTANVPGMRNRFPLAEVLKRGYAENATLNAQTKSLHFNKIRDHDTSFFMLGWTPGSYDAYNPLQNLMTLDGEGQGAWNSGRYTNPRVEELTDEIAQTIDEEKRSELLREAFQIHKDEVGHVPLHQQALAWGYRSDTVEELVQRPFNDIDLRTVVMK